MNGIKICKPLTKIKWSTSILPFPSPIQYEEMDDPCLQYQSKLISSDPDIYNSCPISEKPFRETTTQQFDSQCPQTKREELRMTVMKLPWSVYP